jgi:hypothetical protein
MSNQALTNYRVISSARLAVRDGVGGLHGVPALLKRILKEEMWREFVVAETGQVQRYDRFIDFVTTPPLEGMGTDLRTVTKLCEDDPEALDLLNKATIKGQGDRTELHNNIMKLDRTPQGTSRAYSLRKLAADAPMLHTRVLAGELSPHAAMVEAGFRDRAISVPVDAEKAARAIRRHFTPDQIAELINLLSEEA